MSILTAIILDTRVQKKDGTYHLKIRVTNKKEQKYLKTRIHKTEQQWEQIKLLLSSDKVPKEHRVTVDVLNTMLAKTRAIIDKMVVYNFEILEREYYGYKVIEGKLSNYYTKVIEQMKKEERWGSATCYQNSISSLTEFKKNVDFDIINAEFLQSYENWMLKERKLPDGKIEKPKSITTVGIYLRALRAIINLAIADKILPPEYYPFGEKKYEIPSGRNIKKALDIDTVRSIYTYPCEEWSTMERSRDMWMFSYLCNGINIRDIALLKYKNMSGDTIEFVREKTKRSKKDKLTKIEIYVRPEALAIINKWGNPSKPNNYIFPIIDDTMSSDKKYKVIKQFGKVVNKYTRMIANLLGIEKDITTYTARHSFSDILQKSGTDTLYIKEALGHSSLKTTENYLSSFSKEKIKEHTSKLL